MVVPRHVKIARRIRMSSSYVAARTRERARLDFLDGEISRLKKIVALKREIKDL